MDHSRREALIASVRFEPPLPLTEEERAAWQCFQACKQALAQIEREKRQLRHHHQVERYHGRATSVALTAAEKAGFQRRKATLEDELQALGKLHDEAALCGRQEFERSQTQWTLLEVSPRAPEGRMVSCLLPAILERHLFGCYQLGGRIEEVFVNGRRLTPDERRDFLAAAIQRERACSRGFCSP